MRRLYFLIFTIVALQAQAQITLLKDINLNLSTTGSSPSNMAALGNYVYFSATDGVTGYELWRSDGTAAGTTQVKDIRVGDLSSSPARLTVIGSYIYFAANDGENGAELWRTDGTSAGTILVKDINPGLANSTPGNFTVIDANTIYFSAVDATNGRELWKTNVATLATTLIQDINSGTANSSPANITFISGTTAYFSATDASAGSELWRTDGTTVSRIKDINPSGSSSPSYFAVLGSSVLFSANDGTNGAELWITNGTSGGTVMLKDINTTAGASGSPTELVTVGSYVFFAATDATNGTELWRTDGTTTQIIFNINTTAGAGSYPSYLTQVGGTAVYFQANDGTYGYELMRFTTTGVLTKFDINVGAGSSYPYQLTNINGILYLQADTGTGGYELHRVNGTTLTTYNIQVGAGSSYPSYFCGLGATDVFFSADDGSGAELWKWNGTAPVQVADLVTGSDGSNPYNFVYDNVTGNVYFAADDGTGYEVWKKDGNTGATTLLKNINTSGGSNPSYLTVVSGVLFFSAYDGTDTELWKSDGTTTTKVDLVSGTGSSYPSYITAFGLNTVVFQAYHPSYGYETWKCDTFGNVTLLDNYVGTSSGSPNGFVVMGSYVYYQATNATVGTELFRWNGVSASPEVVTNIDGGTGSSYPSGMTVVGNTIYFYAYAAATGYELYKTTGIGFTLIKDIAPGTDSSYPYYFTALNGVVYFQAYDLTNGSELWKSDGTTAGTVLVKDIYTGAQGSSPYNFFAYNNKLYFVARDLTAGYDMWVTDGTTAGTNLFKDINPGLSNGGFSYPSVYNGRMYMIGNESTGSKVYVTDGQVCTTVAVTPYAGAQTSTADELVLAGTKYVFSLNAKGIGREFFQMDPALVTLPVAPAITGQPQPATVTMPAQASFTVTATGTGLTYQWQKGGVNIPGATAATYTIASTSDTDAGLYKVIVTGTCGQLISTEVQLTVNIVTPSAQPTALVFSNRTTTAINVAFTAAAGPPGGYLVIRKKDAAPTETPVDGTTYTAGAALGTSTVIKIGSSLSVNDTGLTGGSQYFYAVFSYNGSGATSKFLTTSPLTGSTFTLAAEPTQQPTALVFSNLDGATLTGSFTAAASATKYLVIRKAGSAPTGVPTDGTIYAIGDAIGDGTVAYLGDPPTFNDTGLTPETGYYYAVFSANGNGPAINYLVTTPLQGNTNTLAALPDAPTALKFTNVAPTSYTVSYTAPAAAPAGYVVLRKSGTNLTGAPTDGNAYTLGATVGDAVVAYVGPNTTFDEALTLAPYTYAVFPFNGSGAARNYRTATPLTGFIGPDNTAPIIDNQTPATVASGQSFKIVAGVTEGESGIQEVTVEYRSVAKGGSTTKQPMVLSQTSGKYEYEITANEIGDLGIEYTIAATNTLTLKATKAGVAALSVTNPPMPFNSFGDAVTNYRIVATPYDLTSKTVNDVFADDLGTYDGVNWRMYRYDNSSTNELSSSTPIEVGKGYWLIVKTSTPIDLGTGKTVSVTVDAPFTIDLKEGWNQIGNPYNFNVLWADVKTASNVNLALRTYVGAFNDATTLNKFQGGFVFANGNVKLTFPTAYNPTAGRVESPALLMNPIDQESWEVRFNVTRGETQNTFGGFGMNRKADVLYDEFDDFTLPRFVDFVELNHSKKLRKTSFTKDIVPTELTHTWEFTIESNKTGITEIKWDNSYFGDGDRQLVLWDEADAVAIDMRKNNGYAYESSAARVFKVFYGDKKFVAENAAANNIVIQTVYPNPTESEVNVTFTLPGTQPSNAIVRVVNNMGQPITHLFDGVLEAGSHTMNWNGRDAHGIRPAQGLYLVEVLSNGQRTAKRVVLK